MKKAAFYALVCALLLLQISPVLPLADYGIRPDFLLIVAVFSAIRLPLCGGALLVFATSCFAEVFSGVNRGLYPIIYLSIFLSIRSLEGFFDFSRASNLLLFAFLSLSLKFLMLLFCFHYIYEFRHFDVIEPFLQEAVYTLLVFPAAFPLLGQLYSKQKDAPVLKDVLLIHEQRYR